MRTISKILLSSLLFAAIACATDEDLVTSGAVDTDLVRFPDAGADDDIDTTLFSVINLDYPGLERVRECYDKGEYYQAAWWLREYYRDRNTVFDHNTASFLMNPSVSVSEVNIADQALSKNGYRFYVNNFSEGTDPSTGLPIYYSFAADDGSIDWEVNPEGVYTDGTVDSEWSSQKHRHQWMLSQAKVYRYTRDESYILSWIDVYSDWLDRYPCPVGERVNSNNVPWYSLQPAMRAIDQTSIFQYCIQSENFTPSWLSRFLVAFHDTVQCIVDNPYFDTTNNHYLYERQAIFQAGILMPEFVDSDSWARGAAGEINALVEEEFNDDGVLVELDPSYHISAVSVYYDIYLYAMENGRMDLFSSDFLSKLYNAARFVEDLVYPDYSLDNYNDTRSSSWTKRVLLRNFGYYHDMFPEDEELRWMAFEGERGTMPSDHVRKYATSGYYMLRTGWTAADMMLVLKNNYNPDGKWHCQNDNGTFTLWRNGRRFSPDAGCYTYTEGSDRSTYAKADMHNTLTKPEGSIDCGLGKFLLHGTGSDCEYVVTENPHYGDLTHRRAVFLVDNAFYVIVDEGFGSYEGTVDLHFKGGNPDGTVSGRDCFIMDNSDRSGTTGSFDPSLPCGMHTEFPDGNNMIFLTFPETVDGYAATWTTQYFSDTYEEKTQRRVYTIELSKKADLAARFITVICPMGAASEYPATRISASFTDNGSSAAGTFHPDGAALKVIVNDRTYNLSYKLN